MSIVLRSDEQYTKELRRMVEEIRAIHAWWWYAANTAPADIESMVDWRTLGLHIGFHDLNLWLLLLGFSNPKDPRYNEDFIVEWRKDKPLLLDLLAGMYPAAFAADDLGCARRDSDQILPCILTTAYRFMRTYGPLDRVPYPRNG